MASQPIDRFAPSAEVRRQRGADVGPSSWSDEDRSFEVIWTTGAAVTRFDWWDGEYYDETLSVEAAAVRLDRLQAGGPVLLDHDGRTRALAGSIVPGSVRLADGKGFARVRLADTSDVADIVAKVRDGHLRTVSVGYMVHKYERIARGKGERDRMHAVDWEPTEISLTPVPADAGAVVRSRSNTMPEVIEEEDDAIDRPARRRRTVTEVDILLAASRAQITREQERELLERNEERPMTQAELSQELVRHVAVSRGVPHIDNAITTLPNNASYRDMFSEVLFARLSGTEPPAIARDVAGASIVDMARTLLESRGERMRFARPGAVIDAICRAGQHTTSDFVHILDSAARRYLVDAFGSAGTPLKRLARPRSLSDFRKAHGVVAEGAVELLHVPENAEFTRGSFNESKTGIQLHTYGRIFAISRQALINDDLGVFVDMGMHWARAQAELEATHLVALINGTGVTMEDGKALFHADHGNLAGSGTAIDLAALDAGRQAMRNQKNLDGKTFANVVPKYLVTGPAKETEAEQMLATLAAASSEDVNPFAGKLELVVDPRLTGKSWRLFAAPTLTPVLEIATLNGQEGLFLDSRAGFDVDGVEFKARMDIGSAAVDWRGAYMNPGN